MKELRSTLASVASTRRVSYSRRIARGETARPKKDNGHVNQSTANADGARSMKGHLMPTRGDT